MTLASSLPLVRRGKVRDVYAVGDDYLLMIASDRVSAFDVVMAEPIPDKGAVLTALSVFWFGYTAPIITNHLVSGRLDDLPPVARSLAEAAAGRWLLVRRAERIDVECVVRGYLAGSAWAEYRRTGTVCGEPLPTGLVEAAELDEPLFTPTTKAEQGHDQPLSPAAYRALVGEQRADELRAVSIRLYQAAATRARAGGLILADTKFEFGIVDNRLILIDEALTPDSSRYWPADGYKPGRPQPSFDKQFLRDYLEASGWNKEPPPPPLPAEVIAGTADRYREALRRLVGTHDARSAAGRADG